LVWLQGRSLCTTFVAGNFNSFGPGFRAGLCAPPFVGDFKFFGLALGQVLMEMI